MHQVCKNHVDIKQPDMSESEKIEWPFLCGLDRLKYSQWLRRIAKRWLRHRGFVNLGQKKCVSVLFCAAILLYDVYSRIHNGSRPLSLP